MIEDGDHIFYLTSGEEGCFVVIDKGNGKVLDVRVDPELYSILWDSLIQNKLIHCFYLRC